MKIVLVHGLWLTSRSWEHVAGFFRDHGWDVETPEWPRKQGDVEELRTSTDAIEGLGFAEVVSHHEQLVRALPEPPVLVGHSFGGLVVQVLLDRGLGRAGIALDPAPPRGVWQLPRTTLKAAMPALLHPSTRNGVVPLTYEQFQFAFVNTFTPNEAREAYDRYYVPDTGRPLWENAVRNAVRHGPMAVDFERRDRAPLLIGAGGADHVVPPALARANYAKYARSGTITDYVEFPGRSHLLIVGDGWQQVAGTVEEWLARQGIAPTPTVEAETIG